MSQCCRSLLRSRRRSKRQNFPAKSRGGPSDAAARSSAQPDDRYLFSEHRFALSSFNAVLLKELRMVALLRQCNTSTRRLSRVCPNLRRSIALANRNPCTRSKPSSCTAARSAGGSTRSATVRAPNRCARSMMVVHTARLSASLAQLWTNSRSTLSSVKGKLLSRAARGGEALCRVRHPTWGIAAPPGGTVNNIGGGATLTTTSGTTAPPS